MSDQLPGDAPQYVSPHQRETALDLDAAQRDEPTALSNSEIRDRNAHIEGAKDALIVADDLIAGYIPGVNILNGAALFA
jgi:branched-chain amino acid transport system ATP-binding protein